ncbi:MAG: type II toxin-antitoxin system VapC family toxin [Candidatus Binatales bacterium]
MNLTFVDAGVLIAAARGTGDVARRALALLDDPDRAFASSIFVRLEVLPKPSYLKRVAEVEFYETYFRSVSRWLAPDPDFLDIALREACRMGLSAMDAIHLTAAAALGANEFVTSESATKPIFRSASLTVRSIRP